MLPLILGSSVKYKTQHLNAIHYLIFFSNQGFVTDQCLISSVQKNGCLFRYLSWQNPLTDYIMCSCFTICFQYV